MYIPFHERGCIARVKEKLWCARQTVVAARSSPLNGDDPTLLATQNRSVTLGKTDLSPSMGNRESCNLLFEPTQ